ncbi:MAG: MFS transporter, partial [Deltaproteobacteria bacterium]|nr:MFS transporter [Deltaproteobacteria bacterium]
AGASFGIALSLGGGWFPPEHKGLAIGIAGAGNSGAIIAMLAGPPIALAYGWRMAYLAGAGLMIPSLLVMLFMAKEPPDRSHETMRHHLKILGSKDAWIFSASYILTFGGYIGFANFLPTFLHFEYDVSLANMGKFSALIAINASISRIAGGWLADRFGGLRVISVICITAAAALFFISTRPPFYLLIPAFILLEISLGAGNGSTFQLVPLRWVGSTAIVMSLIGEIGALGGGTIPNIMGYSRQHLGTYAYGYAVWGVLAVLIFFMYTVVRRKWEKTWVGAGGKVRKEEVKDYSA